LGEGKARLAAALVPDGGAGLVGRQEGRQEPLRPGPETRPSWRRRFGSLALSRDVVLGCDGDKGRGRLRTCVRLGDGMYVIWGNGTMV